jgi:hypothetical protein
MRPRRAPKPPSKDRHKARTRHEQPRQPHFRRGHKRDEGGVIALRRSRLAARQQTARKYTARRYAASNDNPCRHCSQGKSNPADQTASSSSPICAECPELARRARRLRKARSIAHIVRTGWFRQVMSVDGRKPKIGSMDRLCEVMSTVLLTRGFSSLAKVKSADRLPIKIALAMAP